MRLSRPLLPRLSYRSARLLLRPNPPSWKYDLGRSSVRQLHLETVLLPPAVFTGLLIALWTWKSLMMALFQNKIIYMPYLPPNARREKIADYEGQLSGVQWHEQRIRAADGTDLALAVATLTPLDQQDPAVSSSENIAAHVYILYFQGNASSIPPRLPDMSRILKRAAQEHPHANGKTRYSMVCLSYRGYWTSRGRPSEAGINQDTVAAANWVHQLHRSTYPEGGPGGQSAKPVFIVWGQSVGAGFATNLAASGLVPRDMPVDAIILETPFLSMREMLVAFYPQRWIPYRYLYRFLTNHLDSWTNLGVFASRLEQEHLLRPTVFILQAEGDEVVPFDHAEKLEERCIDVGLPVERRVVRGALHNSAVRRGKPYLVDFIVREAIKAMTKDSDQR